MHITYWKFIGFAKTHFSQKKKKRKKRRRKTQTQDSASQRYPNAQLISMHGRICVE